MHSSFYMNLVLPVRKKTCWKLMAVLSLKFQNVKINVIIHKMKDEKFCDKEKK